MDTTEIDTIAVIGAGSMGHGIAEVAALSGYTIHLRDVSGDLVRDGYDRIEQSLTKLVDAGRIAEDDAAAALERIETFVDVEAAVRDADVVIEAVPERMALKKDVYRELDAHAPDDVVYATNTSTLSISELSETVDDPARFCGMHFFNPPVRMPLVEVIRGEHTAEETLDLAEALTESFDKTPIRVRKDTPGFIVNRVLVPMLNEAAWIVHEDDATVAEVDSTAKFGLDLPMGCFELCDQIGIDVAVDVLEYMHETLGEGYAPCPLLEAKVEDGAFGKKAGRGFYDWEDSGADVPNDAVREEIEARLVAVGINEAAKLVAADAADPNEIDEGLRLGAGFPEGPTRLAAEHGYDRLRDLLIALHDETGAVRYAPADRLEEWAIEGGPDADGGSEGSA
ncbi:3-hydroxyacyl-CoA dehydrogenase [Natrinema sp. 1APR25-10V2]|nr:3-hydroxyacyl-CoA dehydrogenase NAD-binding domain-containing protein [Natrinema sp. 1APR25-10V2]MDS0477032.1 3-hydroxyacyl-CoA dehydrogenase [Natrinema sp. 1APR25-10V2]